MKSRSLLMLKVLSLFGIMLGTFSCDEFGGEIDSQADQKAKIVMNASESYTFMAEDFQTYSFDVSSNTPWVITSSAEWCRATPSMSSMGNLVATVQVSVVKSEQDDTRNATLTITAEGIDSPTVINVSQDGTIVFQVEEIDQKYSILGGDQEFAVTSSRVCKAWSNRTWLTVEKDEMPIADGKIYNKVTAIENPSIAREGTIFIDNGIEIKSFSVTQLGQTMELIEPNDPFELGFDKAGQTRTFLVEAPAESSWVVRCSDPNITTTKLDETTVEVTVGPNYKFGTTTYYLMLESGDATLKADPFEVYQEANYDYSFVGNATYGSNGSSMTMIWNPDVEQTRLLTKDKFRLGTYTWTFSEIAFNPGGFFNLTAWKDPSEYPNNTPYYNYSFDFGYGTSADTSSKMYMTFSTGGTLEGYYSSGSYEIKSLDELKNIKQLKFEILPDPDDESKIIFKLYLNGVARITTAPTANPWADGSPAITDTGMPWYFGLRKLGIDYGVTTDQRVTLTEFKVESYN